MDHALTASELLTVWEKGRSQSPVDRALSLLALAAPETPVEELARWNIGRRDAWLLELRERLFGPHMTGQADCPACGGQVEFNFALADIRAAPFNETDDVLTLQTDQHELRFRLPNSLDLAALDLGSADASSDGTGESPVLPALVLPPRPVQTLLERCLVSARHDGREIAASALPDALVQAVSQKMSEADPQGEIQLAFNCPHCGYQWQSPFDIASFLWSELEAWAVRLLREVHTLASAYSWRESDILAMNPHRRQAYLELIEG